jgi:VWFA-related protein
MPLSRGDVRAESSLVVLALAATWTYVHLGAQQRPLETFRSGREVLQITASVRDANGRPVTDLQSSDFTVRIDGELRPVLAARLFGTDAGRLTDDAVPVPRLTRVVDSSPGRVVVIAIDRESIRSGSEKASLDTAARLLASLSPSDAVGAVGLPGAGIDLTRDHARVAAAISKMTGTAPNLGWSYVLSWDDVLAYERDDAWSIKRIEDRECSPGPGSCPSELRAQAREMLATGGLHAQAVLTQLTDLLEHLGQLRAPKNLVLISGGLPFGFDLLQRYQELAEKAAQSKVTLYVVHLDGASTDASQRRNNVAVSGREFAAGIGNIASSTGGAFFTATGRATGVFERIVSEINYFYELGLEFQSSDGNGKPHRVEVKVNRSNMHVRAPGSIVAAPMSKSNEDALARAMAQPTDVAELPLEVASYVTHSTNTRKVRLLVNAGVGGSPAAPLRQWAYRITDGVTVIGARHADVETAPGQPWSVTDSIEIPPGRYRLRTAIVDSSGRIGVIDQPITAELRPVGGVQASDLIVGAISNGQLEPQARMRQDQVGAATIELSSAGTLAGTTAVLEIIRGGTAEPIVRQPLELRTREQDRRIVVGQARLDLSSLPPGVYTASASFGREGGAVARVIRILEILPGVARDATAPEPVVVKEPGAAAVRAPTRITGSQTGERAGARGRLRFGVRAAGVGHCRRGALQPAVS